MDGREGMALSGSASYYVHRGFSDSGSGTHPTGFQSPPGFRSITNINRPVQSNFDARGSPAGQTFPVESSQSNFHRGSNTVAPPSAAPSPPQLGESVKRKRGRPRKYGPVGAVSLGLSPISPTISGGGVIVTTPTPKRPRGRPRGSGRKQRLASLGQWMTESAGIAFAPHIISVAVGEDVAAKVLSFAQQRPRAVCIMSGNGTVSSVILRQPASSVGNLRFEGRFEILCLSGSYLLSQSGSPRSRIGGLNVSLSTSGGPIIGGSVEVLVAASPVQVVACSFVYGTSKIRNNPEPGPEKIENSSHQLGESATPSNAPTSQHHTPSSAIASWSGSRSADLRNPHNDIDLTRG